MFRTFVVCILFINSGLLASRLPAQDESSDGTFKPDSVVNRPTWMLEGDRTSPESYPDGEQAMNRHEPKPPDNHYDVLILSILVLFVFVIGILIATHCQQIGRNE